MTQQDSDSKIRYSAEYESEDYIMRHVFLPKDVLERIPDRLMDEEEWRGMGVALEGEWEHFMIHKPEPHILLFRKPKK